MSTIEPCRLPESALLARYARDGAYSDCYAVLIEGTVDCSRFVEAFYTTPLFRLERLILKLAIRAPSTDDEARRLARGTLDRFAAWHVEDRMHDQLMMCDLHGSTRSWFMVEPSSGGGRPQTRLYFGSAVVEAAMKRRSFRALIGFHVLYSKALLWSARRRLLRASTC